MSRIIIEGKISSAEAGEGSVLAVAGVAISIMLMNNARKQVTVRYHVSSVPMSLEQADEHFVNVLYGEAAGDVYHRYSDMTGYLWTEEDGTIGGHDLVKELSSSYGKYAAIECIVHDEVAK